MKIKIMGRYKIIELLSVICFIGIHNSSGSNVDTIKKLYKAETELFDRLLSYYGNAISDNPEAGSSSYQPPRFNDNGDLNIYPDEMMFDLVQVWYTLFWVSVNLKVRSMVHKMEYTENPFTRKEIKIAKDFDLLFRITSEIFENLKSDITNYYGMRNKNTWGSSSDSSDNDYNRSMQTICGTTSISSSSDTDRDSSIEETNIDIAESVWEELLKLNLDFLMSTKVLEKKRYSSDYVYTDGLIKWSKINYTANTYKTVLPNNSPRDTNYFVIDDYYKCTKNNEARALHWCGYMIFSIINVNIHKKIMNCFTTRLIGDTMNNTDLYNFLMIATPNVEELKHYLEKFNKGPQDIRKTIAAIQMVRIFMEQILIFRTSFTRNAKNLLSKMEKKHEERKKEFFEGNLKR